MQKSDNSQRAVNAHRKVQSSTTLSRRYVKQPVRSIDNMIITKKDKVIKRPSAADPRVTSPKIQPHQQETTSSAAPTHKLQVIANDKLRQLSQAANQKQASVKKLTAKELKDRAIQKALSSAAKTPQKGTSSAAPLDSATPKKHMHFGMGRIVLALSCTAAMVGAIVYFVNLNMPDISLRVAAMQTGIEASYPSYIPRDFNLTDIESEEGKITMNFSNATTGTNFSLIEERSSWDSNALLSNYVKKAYGDNYIAVREQGLTIYISNSDAAWVNGGIIYKIVTQSGLLTKKQIQTIAVSL